MCCRITEQVPAFECQVKGAQGLLATSQLLKYFYNGHLIINGQISVNYIYIRVSENGDIINCEDCSTKRSTKMVYVHNIHYYLVPGLVVSRFHQCRLCPLALLTINCLSKKGVWSQYLLILLIGLLSQLLHIYHMIGYNSASSNFKVSTSSNFL